MNGAAAAITLNGLRRHRRAGLWWALGLASYVVLNLAFWPSFENSEALRSLDSMSEGLLEAFGAGSLATPSGYLDGQVFALMLPLLLSGMAVAVTTANTSGDEDAGRLEVLHALPVPRVGLWLARLAADVGVIVAVTAVVAAVAVACLPVFGFDAVRPSGVVAATAAAALLGTFHAAVGFALGCAGLRRAAATSVAMAVAIAGYLAAVVLPMARSLESARLVSPWHWTVGRQPVSDGVSVIALLAVAGATVAVVVAGTVLLDRRDIRG